MPHYGHNSHLGQTTCTLCRHQAEEGCIILNPHQAQYEVNECASPCIRCSRYPTLSIWYHKSCYEILVSSYKTAPIPTPDDLEELGRATSTLYLPPSNQKGDVASVREGLFSHHTKYIMQDSFRQDLLRQLPMELLTMILKYIGLCRYLIVLGESRRLMGQLRIGGGYRCERLSLSGDIYITRTNYQGISYISRISNTPGMLSSDETFPGESLSLPPNTQRIILSQDHMGVRNIQFSRTNSDLSADGSPWYECIGISDAISDAEMEISCNGLFLRSVRLCSGIASSVDRLWSSPYPPKVQSWNLYRIQYMRSSRLHYIQLHTGITGLTVCCMNGRNIGIHAFPIASREYKSFINKMKQRAIRRHLYWMFFPINPGESIDNIWIRQFRGCEGEFSNPVIVLQTSRLRTITFGPYIPLHLRHILRFYSLLRNGDGVVSGLCHNGLDPESRYISEIGVTCNPHYAKETVELEPKFDSYLSPPIPPGGWSSFTSWYITKARLQGLVEVQFCQDNDQPHHPCIGLLLYYDDESVETLGQIRWDQKISDKILAPIRIQRSNNVGKDYIRDIQGTTLADPRMAEDGWQKIPKHGIVVWWFSQIGDELAVYDV